jgi:hypothetical protein
MQIKQMHDLRERVLDLLEYDPADGSFTWVHPTHPRIKAGQKAGSVGSGNNRYVRIKVDGVTYYAHRLAFLVMEGWMPEEVDHEDLNRSNNAWANLRPATRVQQNQNRPVQSRNKLGIKGVSFEGGRYRAKIRAGGKSIHLGSFTTEQAAIEAYAAASRQYHGEFGRAA